MRSDRRGVTNTGRIGIIGGWPYPYVIAEANAFYTGAYLTYHVRTGAPINFSIDWIHQWDDRDQAESAAQAFIADGRDAIMGIGGTTALGVIFAVDRHNDTWTFGDITNQRALSLSVIASNTVNFTIGLLAFEAMRAETRPYQPHLVYGMADGANQLIYNPAYNETFFNQHLSNLSLWITTETTAITTNTTHIPYHTTPLYPQPPPSH